ncbi:MAG: DNA-3-methyladenine glycosylase I [Clostridiales bacterium]|nr:DNA-3-methyladenine glycosylase I [Clostridiales bacterium]
MFVDKIKKSRCHWCEGSQQLREYHDNVWGVPVHIDQNLFKMLCLESMQAGLSWQVILSKYDNFMRAFDNFDVLTVSKYSQFKIESLLQDSGIVRNRAKINAIVSNANCVIKLQQLNGSFDRFIWGYVGDKTVQNAIHCMEDAPISSQLSDKISADLKSLGFKFVGSKVIYSWLQAIGLVNDHIITCFRYNELNSI